MPTLVLPTRMSEMAATVPGGSKSWGGRAPEEIESGVGLMNNAVRFGTDDPPVTWGRMTMCEAMEPSHAFLEESGRLELLLRGNSLRDLVAEGGRALGSRMGDQVKRGALGPWVEVEIHANGREAVLAGWLNRLLRLAGRDRWAPMECQVIEVSDRGLRARVRGMPLAGKPRLGRAAVRPGSIVAPGWCGLQAEVILEGPRAVSSRRTGGLPASANRRGRE